MNRYLATASVMFVLACGFVACDEGSGVDPGGATTSPTGSGTGAGTAGPTSGIGTGTGTPGSPATGTGSGATGPAGGTATTSPGGGTVGSTVPGGGPTATNNCGLQKFDLKRLPPELMLVLDKSGSMNDPAGGAAGGGSKWSAMTSALDEVVMKTQAGVLWGLKLFPSDGGCGVNDGVNVDVAINNYSAVDNVINRTNPGGSTPTRLAVQKAVAYMKARTTPNPKYLLLATDGQPNCLNGSTNRSATDDAGAIQAVADAAAAGLPTFVVGIAINDASNNTLDQMAVRGGQPRAGMPRYYAVATRDEFVSVLSTITGQIATCTFSLGSQPPSPNDVAVDADGNRVPRDPNHANGWDYAGNAVVLYGSWCDRVKSGAIKNVQIIFGCPGKTIPPGTGGSGGTGGRGGPGSGGTGGVIE